MKWVRFLGGQKPTLYLFVIQPVHFISSTQGYIIDGLGSSFNAYSESAFFCLLVRYIAMPVSVREDENRTLILPNSLVLD